MHDGRQPQKTRIRPAGAADIAPILEIWNPLIRDTSVTFTSVEKTHDGLAAGIAARGAAFLVTEEAGRILGFASYAAFRAGPGYAQSAEHTVILAPWAQGRGVGRALMKRLEDCARTDALHVLIGGVSGENLSAIAFHRAMGSQRPRACPR